MKESRDYLEMTYRSIQCFADDGELLPDELKKLLEIAKRDGAIDANERRVLLLIIGRLKPEELTDDMRETLAVVRQQVALWRPA
jgi:hypothetical protein